MSNTNDDLRKTWNEIRDASPAWLRALSIVLACALAGLLVWVVAPVLTNPWVVGGMAMMVAAVIMFPKRLRRGGDVKGGAR